MKLPLEGTSHRLHTVLLLLCHVWRSSSALLPVIDTASIQRLQYALDDRIKLDFDPQSLQKSGTWVTVSWQGVDNPSATDFIAAYSPSLATPLTRVPIKYKYASSSKNHITQGRGSVAFRVLNLREDYWFGFFRGNATHPVFAAKSETLKFKTQTEPLGVHLALTDRVDEMRVTWKSDVSCRRPEVRFHGIGTDGFATEQVAKAASSTFTVDDLCGEPAKSLGYHEPGLIHTAVMSGLEPETAYIYRVGDAGQDTWSEEARFVVPPRAGASKALVTVFADMSVAEPDGSLQAGYFSNDFASLNTSRYLRYRVQAGDIDAAVCIGDLSYATGFLSHWDSWMDLMEPVTKRVPFMVSPGNHERDDPLLSSYRSTVSFYNRNEGGGECGVPYSMLFPMPGPAASPRSDKPWYSFEIGPIHFTVTSTEHDFMEGSDQYVWLVRDLETVNRKVTPWIVYLGHRPLYLDSTDDSPELLSGTEQSAARLLRAHLEPLLNKYEVDLALAGHHHSYQRSCKLYQGKCQAQAGTGGAYQGPVYAVIGMAGRRLSTNFMSSPPSYLEYLNGQNYGITMLDADRSSLTLSFIDVGSGATLDEVTLLRPLTPFSTVTEAPYFSMAWVLLTVLGLALTASFCCPTSSKRLCARLGRVRYSSMRRPDQPKDMTPTNEMVNLLPSDGKRYRTGSHNAAVV